MLHALLASLPSPSTNTLGPLPIRAYGVMIALGVVAAVWLSRKRWAARGGDPEDVVTIALWAVPAGLIGARLYHVATDWKTYFPDDPLGALAIWKGGLGIPGGVALGTIVGVVIARRLGIRPGPIFDAVAPALPLAQAIGRFGNWFNQELFGSPTDLPWGLQIDLANRPFGYEQFATFHPTFLYEALWNLSLVGVLLLLDQRRILRPGRLFAVYVGGYFLGRLWVEALRIDTASTIGPFRINTWMSLVGIGAAVAFLLIGGLRRRPDDSDAPYHEGFGPAAAEASDAEAEREGAGADDAGADDRAQIEASSVASAADSPRREGSGRLERDSGGEVSDT